MSDLATLIANVAQLQADVTTIVTRYDDVLNATENVVVNVNAEIAAASNWATYPENQLVPGGNLVDEYSAYHWAQKAAQNAASTVDAAADAATASASATAAATSASNAATSASNALASQNAAASSATTAATNAAATGVDRTAVAADRSAVAADVVSTNADAATASNERATAVSAATSASNHATTALGHANTAATHATKAQQWASAAENVIVESGEYSAFHYMKKCEAIEGNLDIANKLDVSARAADSALLNGQAPSFYLAWANITGRPTTFIPAAHAHTVADLSDWTITGITAGELIKWNGTAFVNNTPAEAGLSVVGHAHGWGEITGKPGTVAGYGIGDVYTDTETNAAISAALAAYTVAWEDVLGKPATFTPSGHSHTESDIVGLDKYTQAEVDAAIAAAVPTWATLTGKPVSFTPSVHTHVKADITDFSDGDYAAAAHTHTFASLSGVPTTFAEYGITNGSLTTLTIGDWTISVTGGELIFDNGVNQVKMTAVGGIVAEGDVTGGGTV